MGVNTQREKIMALKSITMTKAQTKIYDKGGSAADKLMKELVKKAEAKCGDRDMVEIYTADGIVAGYVEGADYE